MRKFFVVTVVFENDDKSYEGRVIGVFESAALAQAAAEKCRRVLWMGRALRFKTTEAPLNSPADWGAV